MNPSRVSAVVVFGLLAVTAGSQCAPAAEYTFPIPQSRSGGGELTVVSGVPVLVLQGTPEEIGRQHGTLVGRHIGPLVKFPRLFLKRVGREQQWPLVAAVGKLLLKRIGNDHRREMQAAISASHLDADALVVANTMLELRRMGGCSSLIVSPQRSRTGQILFGRNFDFPPLGVLDKYSLVCVYRPKAKLAFVCVGFPGLVGVVSGINESGLCIATLDVYGSKDGSPMFDATGVPMMFTFRRLLEECHTIDEAEKLLRRSKATTWMNLAVCDKNGSAVFELTPKSVVARRPVDHLLCCTNHFRTPQLCTSKTCWRYSNLLKSRSYEKLGVAEVAKLLHSANQGGWTIQTMIFEPAAMRLHVALRNPPTSKGPFTTLDVRRLLKLGSNQ